MPTIETIRKMVQDNQGVAFSAAHRAVEQGDRDRRSCAKVRVKEMPRGTGRSAWFTPRAARSATRPKAFLEVVG